VSKLTQRWGRVARVCAVALGFAIVLTSAGYGITRGLLADGTNSRELSHFGCGRSIDDIPFADQLALPTELPKGLRLVNTCSSGAKTSMYQDAEFFYASDEGKLLVVFIKDPRVVPVQAKGRSEMHLGEIVGYASDDENQDGTTSYAIEFAKDGRSCAVGATIGLHNSITRDDVNAVALSIAEK
jgi:hypothetical protein